MNDCTRARRALERRFAGEIELEEGLWLDGHVAGCERCAREDARARRLEDALLALRAPSIERLDLDWQVAAVRRAIDERAREPGVVRSRRPWAGVAALLVACWAGYAVWRGARSAAPEPSAPSQVAQATSVATSDRERAPLPVLPRPTALATGSIAAAGERLRAALDEHRSEGSTAWLDGFVNDARVVELRAEGWPVERLLARLGRSSDGAGQAALLALGVLGHETGLDRLAEALADPERAVSACRALILRGMAAGDVLAAALERDELRALVLEWADGLEQEARRGWIVTALAQRRTNDVTRELLARLAESAAGQAWLLEPSTLQRFGTEAVAAALRASDGAGDALATQLAQGGARERGLLLELCARLAPAEAFEHVVAAGLEHSTRSAALAALRAYHGAEPVAALFAWHAGGGLRRAELRAELSERVRRDPAGVAAAARAWSAAHPWHPDAEPTYANALPWNGLAAGDVHELELLLEACVLAEDFASVPAVLALVECGLLRDDDRERALLAAAAVAQDDQASAFADLCADSLPVDRRLAATCLQVVRQLDGESGVRALWQRLAAPSNAPAEVPPRVLELLRRATGPAGAVARFRLIRELEDLASVGSPVQRNDTP